MADQIMLEEGNLFFYKDQQFNFLRVKALPLANLAKDQVKF
jgi:hypothetical protein